jgi:hypothetical protein
MIALGVVAIRGSRVAALLLIPAAIGWLVINRPFEGPTLLTLSWNHGITAADLFSVAALAIAGWRLVQAAASALVLR